jgi:hypothetical protein
VSEPRKPPVPAGMARRGRAFWRSTVADFDLSTAELLLLEEACRCLDEIDMLRAAVDAEGVSVRGSEGQPRPHPAMAAIRATRGVLGRLLSQLDLPDEDGNALPSALSARGKAAAKKRWASAPPSLRSMKGGHGGAA